MGKEIAIDDQSIVLKSYRASVIDHYSLKNNNMKAKKKILNDFGGIMYSTDPSFVYPKKKMLPLSICPITSRI